MFFISEGMNKGGDSSKIGGRIIKKKACGFPRSATGFPYTSRLFLVRRKTQQEGLPPTFTLSPLFSAIFKKMHLHAPTRDFQMFFSPGRKEKKTKSSLVFISKTICRHYGYARLTEPDDSFSRLLLLL